MRDSYGRDGVTVSFHGVAGGTTSVAMGSSVTVDSRAGTVQSSDRISDSCFVELASFGSGTPKTTTGPLMHVTPRQHDQATFDGLASGNGSSATISGWSPDLPFVAANNQLKVFTDDVTSRGDSGSALLESTGSILGFSFYRTSVGTTPAFSAWIWAHSVFSIHKLTAL